MPLEQEIEDLRNDPDVEEIRSELRSYDSVCGTGIGYALVEGNKSRELCVFAYLEDPKKPKTDLSDSEKIPRYINDVRIDVRGDMQFEFASGSSTRDGVWRPVPGGVRVTNDSVQNSGTAGLGIIDSGGNDALLGVRHVFGEVSETDGSDQTGSIQLHQADTNDTKIATVTELPDWSNASADNQDWAIAQFNTSSDMSSRAMGLDVPTAVEEPTNLNSRALSAGINTGFTSNNLTAIDVEATVQGIHFYPCYEYEEGIGQSGDSGSVVGWWDDANSTFKIYALHFAQASDYGLGTDLPHLLSQGTTSFTLTNQNANASDFTTHPSGSEYFEATVIWDEAGQAKYHVVNTGGGSGTQTVEITDDSDGSTIYSQSHTLDTMESATVQFSAPSGPATISTANTSEQIYLGTAISEPIEVETSTPEPSIALWETWDDFEDSDMAEWSNVWSGFAFTPFVVSPADGSTQSVYGDTDSVSNFELARRGFPQSLSKVRLYYYETSSSSGGGYEFFNANSGDRAFAFGTANPQWEYYNGTENRIHSGDDRYQEWHQVTLEFDYDNWTVDLTWENLTSGHTETRTGISLENQVEVTEMTMVNQNNDADFATRSHTGSSYYHYTDWIEIWRKGSEQPTSVSTPTTSVDASTPTPQTTPGSVSIGVPTSTVDTNAGQNSLINPGDWNNPRVFEDFETGSFSDYTKDGPAVASYSNTEAFSGSTSLKHEIQGSGNSGTTSFTSKTVDPLPKQGRSFRYSFNPADSSTPCGFVLGNDINNHLKIYTGDGSAVALDYSGGAISSAPINESFNHTFDSTHWYSGYVRWDNDGTFHWLIYDETAEEHIFYTQGTVNIYTDPDGFGFMNGATQSSSGQIYFDYAGVGTSEVGVSSPTSTSSTSTPQNQVSPGATSKTASVSTVDTASPSPDVQSGVELAASGSSTTSGQADAKISQTFTASGVGVGSGLSTIDLNKILTASGTSTVQGTATIESLRTFTASGSSTVTTSATLATAKTMTASGSSTVAGTGDITSLRTFSASGSSTTGGSATLLKYKGIEASGSATTDGNASALLYQSLTASGSSTTSGSATLPLGVTLSATGSSIGTGSATTSIQKLMSSSGSAIGTGSATISKAKTISATGVGVTGGSADILSSRTYTASGSAIGTGSAVKDISKLMAASGASVGSGSATMARAKTMVGQGTGATGGTATLSIGDNVTLVASGAGTTGGSATLERSLAIAASGASTTGGTADLLSSRTYTASGASTTAGSASLSKSQTFTASGSSTTGGVADLLNIIRFSSSGSGVGNGAATTSLSKTVSATGVSAGTGSASLLIGNNVTLAASTTAHGVGSASIQNLQILDSAGTAAATGTGTISKEQTMSASGISTTQGTATLLKEINQSASGSALGTGAATVYRESVLSASGASTTGGTAAIKIGNVVILLGSGSATATGQATTYRKNDLLASGRSAIGGEAVIDIVSPDAFNHVVSRTLSWEEVISKDLTWKELVERDLKSVGTVKRDLEVNDN